MHQYCLLRQATLRNNRKILFEGSQWTIWYTMNVCNHIPLMQQLFFSIVENNSNNKNTTAAPKTLRCIPKQVLFIQSSLELHTWAQKKTANKTKYKESWHENRKFAWAQRLLPECYSSSTESSLQTCVCAQCRAVCRRAVAPVDLGRARTRRTICSR